MRIGVDVFPLCPHSGDAGIARALRETLLELQKLDHENDYYLYSKLDFDFHFKNPRWHKCLHPGIPYTLGTLYLKKGLKDADGRSELDVFWATRITFPFGLGAGVGRVITVYDLVWLHYPETMTAMNRAAFRVSAASGLRQADRILSISESTSRGLEEHFGVTRDKIDVAYLGVSARFAPRERGECARFIAAKYGASADYICAVGTVEPRKNLITLIEAMRFLQQRGGWQHQLLIAGRSGWKNSAVYASIERCGLTEHEVKFLGRVPEEDLPLLYAGAALFVFPSLYEGFGLPLLEAMASGTPVVASNCSSIPEVVGDAGILVSPPQPAEFADAMARLMEDAGLYQTLAQKGLNRAQDFTWEATARKVARALEEAANQARSRNGSR